MEKYVRLYLTRHYEINTSEIGNDGIYDKSDTRKLRPPVYFSKLLKELELLFNLSSEELIKIINEWAKDIKPDIDLEFYWSDFATFFPLTTSVVSNTVSNELIAVQPMEMPSGLINNLRRFYNNYEVSSDTPNRNGRIYSDDLLDLINRRFLDSI